MISISKAQAKDLINTSRGRIFTTIHVKKDGATRVTNGRIGVKKGVTGEGMAYNPSDYNLIPVYDMQNRGYRMVNLATLSTLVINKEKYGVAENG